LLDLVIQGCTICSDSRTLASGQIFFALKGERFNGNNFAPQALELGATAIVIDEDVDGVDLTDPRVHRVDDSLLCLQDLAKDYRKHWGGRVIGITGSNGKTTAKEIFRAVLEQRYAVWATPGNFNNHIGLPLTLLQLKPEHEVAIIEMGANHQGEIETLTRIALPDIGYITNFGQAHLEGFGGIEGVIKGKSELYRWLESAGRPALVNAKDPLQLRHAGPQRITTEPDITTQSLDHGMAISWAGITAQSHLVGNFHDGNLRAAVALGRHLNISDDAIARGIAQYVPQNNRGEWRQTDHNLIFLDAYNANPSSMEASVRAVNQLHPDREHLYIAGDLFEMGDYTESVHQRMIEVFRELNLKQVYLVGEAFSRTDAEGMRQFERTDDVMAHLEAHPPKGMMIWIKGSRGMALERLLPLL